MPCAAARKAPRLCFGMGYLIRWRCRRLHITRGHIAHQNLIVPVSHRICARLADCRHRNYPLGQSKTSCFSLRHERRCSAAKLEDIGLASGDPIPQRCRRCEPWFLAATSLPPRNSRRIRALFKSACVKHRSIVRLAARSQGSTGRGFRSSLSVLAPPTAWLLRLYAGATSRRMP